MSTTTAVRAGHGTAREGVVTGLLGAGGVAAWFLGVDTLAGKPLFTPDALGALLFGEAPGAEAIRPGLVLGYTLFHCLAFLAVGLLAAWSTHLAERQPVVLALFLVVFAVFELAFYGATAVLDTTGVLAGLAWWQIAAGNLVAVLLMGGYLWRRHPRIGREIDFALSR